jgi:hypothetical protein
LAEKIDFAVTNNICIFECSALSNLIVIVGGGELRKTFLWKTIVDHTIA